MTVVVLAVVYFLTGCNKSAQTEPSQDAFARRLDEALDGLTKTRESLANNFPRSDLAYRLANLLIDTQLDLRAYDNQLRKQNLPPTGARRPIAGTLHRFLKEHPSSERRRGHPPEV